jgi:ribonuclease BN (tRNA processing enzyme)
MLSFAASRLDGDIMGFARGATILIHEAQYHPDEKSGEKAGWGHSSWEEAARVAERAGVKRLYLSHHDPVRTDAEVYKIVSLARTVFQNTEIATETTVCDLASIGE